MMESVLEPSLFQKLSDLDINLNFETGLVTTRYLDLSFEFIFWSEKNRNPRKAEQKKMLILFNLVVSKDKFWSFSNLLFSSWSSKPKYFLNSD